ncbi:MAG: zinc-binding dehydrogenase [Roseiarcus sp.]
MKAVFVTAENRPALHYGDFPDPARAPGEVLVRLRAAAVNRMDLYMRDSGAGVPHALPFILGGDGAGEVLEAPEGSSLRKGQKVVLYPATFDPTCPIAMAGDQTLSPSIAYLGMNRSGTFAETISIPPQCLVPFENEIAFETMAALPVAYLTAYRVVLGRHPVHPGDAVLVFGIGGGVAIACLQLAVLAGATVIVVSTSARKLNRARELGASYCIDSTKEKVAERVMAITGRRGADLVVDNVGEATWSDTMRCVRAGGRIVVCGATSGPSVSLNLQRLFSREIEIVGSTLGSVAEFTKLVQLASAGRIEPEIEEVVPLAQASDALARTERGDKIGKIVLSID